MYCINKNISTQVMVKRKLALYKIQKRAGRMANIDSLLIKPVQRLLKYSCDIVDLEYSDMSL